MSLISDIFFWCVVAFLGYWAFKQVSKEFKHRKDDVNSSKDGDS